MTQYFKVTNGENIKNVVKIDNFSCLTLQVNFGTFGAKLHKTFVRRYPRNQYILFTLSIVNVKNGRKTNKIVNFDHIFTFSWFGVIELS